MPPSIYHLIYILLYIFPYTILYTTLYKLYHTMHPILPIPPVLYYTLYTFSLVDLICTDYGALKPPAANEPAGVTIPAIPFVHTRKPYYHSVNPTCAYTKKEE